MKVSAGLIAGASLLVLAAGCATKVQPGVSSATRQHSIVGTIQGNSGAPCLVTDLAALRAGGHLIKKSRMPASLRGYMFASDAKSFAVSVGRGALPLLTPWTGALPPNVRIFVIVNHGEFLTASLPREETTSGRGPAQPPSTAPVPGAATPAAFVAWAIYVIDAETLRPIVDGPIAERASCVHE